MGRRKRRLAAMALALSILAAWVGLHLALDAPASRARLRARSERALSERLGVSTVRAARVDWLFRAELEGIEVLSARPGGAPILRAETAVVAPRLRSLLAGRIEPGAVSLHEVWLDPGLLLAELRGRPRSAPESGAGDGPLPSLRVRRLSLLLPAGGDRSVELGPFDFDASLSRRGGSAHLSAELAFPGGGWASADLRQSDGSAELRGELAVELPGDLPEAAAARAPFDFAGGHLRLEVESSSGADLRAGAGQFRAEVRALQIAGTRLGPELLGPLSATSEGTLRWDAGAHRASLGPVRVSLGEKGSAVVAVEASYEWAPEPRLTLKARTDRLTWAGLVAALPEDLRPPEEAPHLDGPLAAELDLSAPLGHLADLELGVSLDLEELRRSARAGAGSRLGRPFTWRPPDQVPGEPPREIVVGPSNPSYVPISELPPALVRAVTASEDAGFFAHRGFDFQEIANALVERSSGRVRGASTITQQLAKNLFLAPDRTLSRKVREALATVALEAAVPKLRLLEIYLNIAEWGPGVYGVGEAAHYWFAKDARELSPKESAFLASVIPSPRRFAARARKVGISPWWQDRVSDILGKMWIQGQLGDEELGSALDEPLRLQPALRAAAPPGESSDPEAPEAPPEDESPSEPGSGPGATSSPK